MFSCDMANIVLDILTEGCRNRIWNLDVLTDKNAYVVYIDGKKCHYLEFLEKGSGRI